MGQKAVGRGRREAVGTTGVSSSHALLGAGPAAGSPERPEHAEPRLRGRVLWGIYGGDGLTDVKPPHRVLRHPPQVGGAILGQTWARCHPWAQFWRAAGLNHLLRGAFSEPGLAQRLTASPLPPHLPVGTCLSWGPAESLLGTGRQASQASSLWEPGLPLLPLSRALDGAWTSPALLSTLPPSTASLLDQPTCPHGLPLVFALRASHACPRAPAGPESRRDLGFGWKAGATWWDPPLPPAQPQLPQLYPP